jgi:radical SAM superfamily enzyme YgiQ (UPF0313 family)
MGEGEMNILLIYPSVRKSYRGTVYRNQPKSERYPGMGLALVAALSPPEARVAIVDDEREEIDYGRPVDLVGISLLTCAAKRGYAIAREFRKRGIPVVLGGMHVTACPAEAAREADAIVVGEAEDTWPRLLKDFEAGAMRTAYRSTNSVSLEGLPFPRRDLLDKEAYITVNNVQATRGCPFNCEFCSITALFGRGTRCRPVEEVIEEIRSLEGDIFVLNDDNLAQKKDYFKEFFRRLIPLRKRWAGNASWNIATDVEMLELMQRSGCAGVFVGFESIKPQEGVTKIVREENRLELFKEAVRKLHAHRIGVIGAFIFGFDNDDETVFRRTLAFALESRIDTAQINILVPYPGTPLHARLEGEARIFERDWNRYMSDNVCFVPEHMSRETLFDGCLWVKRRFFSYPHVAMRVARAAVRSSPKAVAVCAALNLGFKRGIKNVGRLSQTGERRDARRDARGEERREERVGERVKERVGVARPGGGAKDGVKSTKCQFSEQPGE